MIWSDESRRVSLFFKVRVNMEILIRQSQKNPTFVAIKNCVGLRPFWFKLGGLSKSKKIRWKDDFNLAVEEEGGGPELYRIFGSAQGGEDFVGFNAVYSSFSWFLLCEEIEVEVSKNHVFFQNASFFLFCGDDEYRQVGETQDLGIDAGETPIDSVDVALVKDLETLAGKVVSFDDMGQLKFAQSFSVLKKKYNETYRNIGTGFFGKNYSDLEGLIYMSQAWEVDQKFSW